jgi:uncharacterized RDD family membrane protein YckC
MNCPECRKEVVVGNLFCAWCERFIPNPAVGTKASLGLRLKAHIVDVVLFWVIFFIITGLFGVAGFGLFGDTGGLGGFFMGVFLAFIGYVVVLFWFLGKGLTPGKFFVGEQVVNQLNGNFPGLGRMLLREVLGKFISGLFGGIGYFWAIWDKDNQAWHDKIASTVVIRRTAGRTTLNPSGGGIEPSPGVSRFCTQCGNRLEAGRRFCASCGSSAEQ